MQSAAVRLFFALWPTAPLAGDAEGLGRAQLPPGGRSLPAAGLHITLAFLGPVTPAQHDCVTGIADRLRIQAFDLQLDTLGVWRRSGVAWLAPSVTPPPLLELAARLAAGARDCGLAQDDRPYRAHLTLRRKLFRSQPVQQVPALSWPVREFALAESTTLAAGARYRILRRWPLSALPVTASPTGPGA